MLFVFSIGWSNYTPYLAKEIIGNTLKKCSIKTRVIDLNNYFLMNCFIELIIIYKTAMPNLIL